MHRRRFVQVGMGLSLAGVTVGCVDQVREAVLAQDFTAAAQPARVAVDTVESAGWQLIEKDDHRIQEQFEIGGETQDVEVRNWLTVYGIDRAAISELAAAESDDGTTARGSMFGLLSTPNLTVADQSINPLLRLDSVELLTTLGDRIENTRFEDIQLVEEATVTILGQETAIGLFDTIITTQNHEIQGRLYLASVRDAADVIVTVGAHPKQFPLRDDIFRLAEHVIHPAAEPSGPDGSDAS